jgi:hypothetical protein
MAGPRSHRLSAGRKPWLITVQRELGEWTSDLLYALLHLEWQLADGVTTRLHLPMIGPPMIAN